MRKLPDKGAKLKESIAKIEVELAKKKQCLARKQAAMPFEDLGKLEWTLVGAEFNETDSPKTSDSGDHEILEEGSVESTFKIIAGSQISQRQAKPTLRQPVLREENGARTKETTSSVIDRSARPDIYDGQVVESHLTEESESDAENAAEPEATKISNGLSKLLNTNMKMI